MSATTIGTFALFFLFALVAWHLIHLAGHRWKLGKHHTYELAGGLGLVTFIGLKVVAGTATACLSTYWYITVGLTAVTLFLYDWIQDRFYTWED